MSETWTFLSSNPNLFPGDHSNVESPIPPSPLSLESMVSSLCSTARSWNGMEWNGMEWNDIVHSRGSGGDIQKRTWTHLVCGAKGDPQMSWILVESESDFDCKWNEMNRERDKYDDYYDYLVPLRSSPLSQWSDDFDLMERCDVAVFEELFSPSVISRAEHPVWEENTTCEGVKWQRVPH